MLTAFLLHLEQTSVCFIVLSVINIPEKTKLRPVEYWLSQSSF